MTKITIDRSTVEQALEALEALRLGMPDSVLARSLDQRIAILRDALQPNPVQTQSQKLAAAGFTPRDKRLKCDECGGKFTRQMLPIHKCGALSQQVQEPDHTYKLIGCVQHDCEECQRRTQRPAEPVGVVTSMVKGGVTWRRWPADMPDGTLLFSEVQP